MSDVLEGLVVDEGVPVWAQSLVTGERHMGWLTGRVRPDQHPAVGFSALVMGELALDADGRDVSEDGFATYSGAPVDAGAAPEDWEPIEQQVVFVDGRPHTLYVPDRVWRIHARPW